MGRPSAMASLVAAAAALLLLIDGCSCTMYKVGGLDAWAVPPASKPDVYIRWGKSIRFKLGDSVWFLYPPSQDSVVQVTAKAFAACDVADPVLKLDDGNSIFNLTAPGRAYYTSAVPGHCKKGQKLTLDVPTAKGAYLPPSADDLAALAASGAVVPPPAEAPAGAESLPALAPVGGAPSAAHRAVNGAGSVLAAAAALCFTLFV